MMEEGLYNPSFERTVLSSILYAESPDEREEMFLHLDEELFYMRAHSDVYNAFVKLAAMGKPIDEEFVKKVMLQSGTFDEMVMMDVMTSNPMSNISHHVAELREMALLRRLLMMTTAIKRKIIEEGYSSGDVCAFIDCELMEMEERMDMQEPITMVQAMREAEEQGTPPLIETGIPGLDRIMCGGVEPAQLVHVGGEKNVGKTTLTKQILRNVSNGFPSLFFSFEMPRWKIARQFLRVKQPWTPGQFYIIDQKMMGVDITDVDRMARRMIRKRGIRFIVIDSKMKLKHRTFTGNEPDKKADIDAILSRICQETDVVIYEIVQISNENVLAGRMNSYGSGLSDYEADMQILLKNTDQPMKIEAKITKNRQDVMHESAHLWLDEKTLEFSGQRMVTYEYEGMGGVDETTGMITI